MKHPSAEDYKSPYPKGMSALGRLPVRKDPSIKLFNKVPRRKGEHCWSLNSFRKSCDMLCSHCDKPRFAVEFDRCPGKKTRT